MKTCSKCKLSIAYDKFSKGTNGGYASYCKECAHSYYQSRYQNKKKIMKMTETHKQCRVCEQLLTFDNYSGKRNPYCKECHSYLGHVRNVKKYGITPDEYLTLLKEQQYKCYICKKKTEKRLSVDHNNACCAGEKSCGNCIRGLLCFECNIALGMVKDNVDTLQSMIDYLKIF